MGLIETINVLCERQLGRRPNLSNPTGYNDLIQWLKVHDQRLEQVICCDKVAVREYVAARAGDDILIPAVDVDAPDHYPFIVKPTHDSGGGEIVRSKFDRLRAIASLQNRLAKPYGVEKGEWAYGMIAPGLIAERLLPDPVVDFKFHCSHNRVRWVQVIWDRGQGTKETIFLPDGTVSHLHMDEKMEHLETRAAYPGDRAWEVMTDLALQLAAGWRYVRIDLYWKFGRAWFGEMTFWPRAGCYRSSDEPVFGEMLELDLTEKLLALVAA